MLNHKRKISVIGTVVWLIAALFFLYEFFLRDFVGTLAHQIIPDLGLTAETFALIGSAYYIAYGLMQIPVGILVDKFGVKANLLFACLACVVSTYLFIHSVDFWTAAGTRLVMGFGSSFAFVCLVIVVSNWFPARHFGLMTGLSQFIGTMGPVLAGGPLVILMKHFGSWRDAMLSTAIFGILLAVLVLCFVRNQPTRQKKSIIFLDRARSQLQQIKKLFANPQAWWIALYSSTVYVSIALMAAVWGTEYLQVRGLPQSTAAYMESLSWIGYAIGCPTWGFISDRLKRRKPYLVFPAVIGFISTTCIVYFGFSETWIYAVLFFGLGLAAAGQNLGFVAIVEHNEPQTKAAAVGLNNGVLILLGALVPPIASMFISHAAGSRGTEFIASDFTVGLSVMPLLYIISTIVSLCFIKETYGKPQRGMVVLNP